MNEKQYIQKALSIAQYLKSSNENTSIAFNDQLNYLVGFLEGGVQALELIEKPLTIGQIANGNFPHYPVGGVTTGVAMSPVGGNLSGTLNPPLPKGI